MVLLDIKTIDRSKDNLFLNSIIHVSAICGEINMER